MTEVIKLTEDIWYYKNVHPDIFSLLERTRKHDWRPYTNAVNPDGSECHSGIVGSATVIPPSHEAYMDILNIFMETFKDYVEKKSLDIPIENLDIYPDEKRSWMEQKYINMREYRAGSVMFPHEDGGVDIIPSYTGLLYFNEDFEGGELKFTDLDISVKPSKASLLIFPSNTNHEVTLVTGGNRYATSAYLYKTPSL